MSPGEQRASLSIRAKQCTQALKFSSNLPNHRTGADKDDSLPSVSSTKEKGDAPVVEDVQKVRSDSNCLCPIRSRFLLRYCSAQVQEDIDSAFKETVSRAVSKTVAKEVKEKPTSDVSICLK